MLLSVISLALSGCSVSDSISKYNPFKKAAPAVVQTENPENINVETPVVPQTSGPAITPEAPIVIPAVTALNKENAFKGVVKIKTLTLGADGGLVDYLSGSGVVISQDGFILTNSHVVAVENELDKSDKNAVYGVCFTADMNKEPDCSQTAELVAKDKDFDIALLHLNTSGSSPFLKLAEVSTASTSDEVFALGYPGIGQDTITMTKGIVSGKLDKYDKKWIKTDAVISFGSSGGAAIDKNGEVLGITTAGYSDTLGTLGYIIDSTSIMEWIKKAETDYKAGAANPLTERALKFLNKQEELKTAAVFTSVYPDLSITHPDGWDFQYFGENSLTVISKKEADKSGSVQFEFIPHPYLLSEADIDPILKQKFNDADMLSLIKINKEQAVEINGLKGRKITVSAAGQMENFYMLPWREYMVEISYGYGENDKDKTVVDGIINSLKAGSNTNIFNEVFAYRSADPVFGITAIKGWPLIVQSDKAQPIKIESKKIKGAFISLSLIKKTDEIKDLTNEDFLENVVQQNDQVNQMGAMLDYKNNIISQSANYKINDEFAKAMKIENVSLKASNGEVLSQSLEYSLHLNDQYLLALSLDFIGSDKNNYKAAVADFNKIAASLTIVPKVDSDNDGLSDEEELKLTTDPKNSDTDGDGYLDGSEAANGYNPLGK